MKTREQHIVYHKQRSEAKSCKAQTLIDLSYEEQERENQECNYQENK